MQNGATLSKLYFYWTCSTCDFRYVVALQRQRKALKRNYIPDANVNFH